MKTFRNVWIAFAAIALLVGSAYADTVPNGPQKAKTEKFVKNAICYIFKHGEQKAFKKFNQRSSRFSQGDQYLYVFVYKGPHKGEALAHPHNPEYIGSKKVEQYKDLSNQRVMNKIYTLVQNNGGWMKIDYQRPSTKKVEDKYIYVLPVPGTDYFIGSGFHPN